MEQIKYEIKDGETVLSCNCVGPQNGQPLCPCQMRNVKIVGGRYIQTIDLGPVHKSQYAGFTKEN